MAKLIVVKKHLAVDFQDFELTKVFQTLLSVNSAMRDQGAVGHLVLARPVDAVCRKGQQRETKPGCE